MMTTAYPHNPGMHPQSMPHGHPMGGPGPNPGQQMPPGMQHVSGPGGPVSQAGPMMAMQPGMGPNAHALSHLQPQQAHMFQQQQQHPMMNPAMMQQQDRARQHAFMQRQQQQALLAQQQGMGFQNPMANINGQQQMLRAGQMGQGFVNLSPHLQQQLQQQQQMGQQQNNPQHQAAMAQAQAAHHQHQQLIHQQQAIAMQHAQSQSSNHSQNGNPGPPPTTQPQQGPLRPPSAIGSHQGQSSPAPQPTPQQPQQPPPQPPQQQPQQSGPGPQQHTPAPAQPPNLPQQPNHQAQNQAQMLQRNPGMIQQAQAHAQAQAQAHAAQARQQPLIQHKQQAQSQSQSGGQATLKLLNFVEQIGKFTSDGDEKDPNSVSRWQTFVDKFFTETGSFIHVVTSASSDRTKQWEIVYAALPRFFYTLFNTDVTNLQITLDGATEKTAHHEHKVTCDRAKFIYTYRNQCQVVYQGKLTAFWSGSDRMEWLQFDGSGHEQFIPRAALKQLFHQPSPNQMNPTQSPRMGKGAKQKLQQQRVLQEPPEAYLPISKLISASITDFGLPHMLQNHLETYETINNMSSLMAHYHEQANMMPFEALESWNSMMSNSQTAMQIQQGQGQSQGMQPGVRPPGPGQPGPMFMSPALANQLLPNGSSMNGSPSLLHSPSPASHVMIKQQSTSSHTASVNTSPNMNNKRRRSTAKIEIDDGGGEMNGAPKVKASPRVGGGKRMKAGN
ncbi:hypothetical protein EJ02DRAFT_464329 [Clathrospora elynae]|uniref:LIM-domain binding protein-domain-containing protein n=1 Tax=Clathrospora elynae TaxID=706981 RepID=A0A6A5SY00_9PLEO|nr:hypothetical protein EJ02DRAFT_464329 [Clathrospora elynae]